MKIIIKTTGKKDIEIRRQMDVIDVLLKGEEARLH